MVSKKLERILFARGAPFAEEELLVMPDSEGWAWVYANPPPMKPEHGPEVCFTGFGPGEKAELTELAKAKGYHCVTAVTKNLAILCTGPKAGPSKLAKARDQGTSILLADEFRESCGGDS